MDSSKEDLVLTLKSKVKTIIDLYETQKKINKELENNNRELKEKLILLEDKVSDVEEKYENLRLAKALVSSGDSEHSHEAKIQVNRIVREIDKCIALLNR
ncbi:MAG: hypothetical protein JW973_01915 [Bacteroidales bacterium]|nr:hypothetical protein [Bacteroidales bacterium]